MGLGINGTDLKVMRDLAYISGLRGLDSTGILEGKISYSKWGKPKYDIVKEALPVGTFLDKYDRKVIDSATADYIAGHVRWATVGDVTDENSHPFEFNNIIGMHNGTLREKKYESKLKTDSELMFSDMDERGVEEVLSDLSKESAYAIVVFDKETGDFNFARNRHRTLWFMIHEKRRVLYWASEDTFLEFIAKKHNLDIPENGIKYAKEDYVYTVNPQDIQINKWPVWHGKTIKYKAKEEPPKKTYNHLTGPKVTSIKYSKEPPHTVPTPNSLKKTGDKKADVFPLIPSGPSSSISEGKKGNDNIPSDRLKSSSCVIPCHYCSTELNLVDQYFADEISLPNSGETGFICASCVESFKEIDDSLKQKVSIN